MLRRFYYLLGFCLLFTHSAFAAMPDVDFTVNMSEVVTVNTGGGTPQIVVHVDGQTRYASYVSGTGTAALTFRYAPTIGDLDLDGVTLTSPLDLNGGTITDLNGNALTPLTFTVPNTSGVKIDYPSLSMDFVYDADGRYTLNGTAYNDLSSFLGAAGGTFSRASTATYYDSTGTLQTASANTPRFDYDPVTHTAKGILIEESRTNLISNSTMAGAVINGAAPTGWYFSVSGGLAFDVVGLGTEQGMNYVDVRLHGTTTATTYPSIYLSGATDISATIGETYTISTRSRVIAGSHGSITASIAYRNSGAGLVSGGGLSSNLPLSGVSLTSLTNTVSDAGTAYIHPRIFFSRIDPPAAVDVTVRIMVPQLEEGTFPTSYIPTTSAAVTRSADSFTLPSSGQPWFNGTTGTLYAFFDGGRESNNSTYGRVVSPSISYTLLSCDGGSTSRVGTWGGVTSPLLQHSGQDYYTTAGSAAMSYDQGAMARSLSTRGKVPATGSYTTPYVFGTWGIGRNSVATTNMLNGHIQKLKYYPARVSDTQLQLLTQ